MTPLSTLVMSRDGTGLISDYHIHNPAKFCEVSMYSCISRKQAIWVFLTLRTHNLQTRYVGHTCYSSRYLRGVFFPPPQMSLGCQKEQMPLTIKLCWNTFSSQRRIWFDIELNDVNTQQPTVTNDCWLWSTHKILAIWSVDEREIFDLFWAGISFLQSEWLGWLK